MRKLVTLVVALSVVLGLANAQDSLLDEIQERGTLVCGVNAQLPGFGAIDSDGNFTGFDVDFCRATAAAVLGDADAVEYRGLNAAERFTALQTGEIDVLIRNTTWTSSRDSEVGANFAPTTFYDGQGFIVREASGITDLADFEGTSICVQSGTTTELNLADVMAALDIEFTPLTFESADQTFGAYEAGQCDSVTTDKSGLVSRSSLLQNPEDHVILPQTISKEPLGPAVLHGDDAWFDVIKWVTFGTIFAEEYGITSDNVLEVAASAEAPVVRRFLGVDGEALQQLGLEQNAMIDMIQQVGNYGEIFARHLGADSQFNLDRGLNALYTDGGLLYAPPFR
jgi:general L-amino acid transport system substrate-binding protein